MPEFASFFSSLDLTNPFKIANLIVGILFVLGGISQFFPVSFDTNLTTNTNIDTEPSFTHTFTEFRVPPLTYRYASFLFSFIGRGVFYIFIGSLLLHDHVLRIIAGSVIGVTGVAYVAAEFVPTFTKPESMSAVEQNSEYENATETL